MIRIVTPGAACALVLLASACTKTQLSPHVGSDVDVEVPPAPAAKKEAPPPPPDDVVEKAALPFHGVRSEGDEKLEGAAFFAELARADAICVGERHDEPSDHFAQLAVLRALQERQEVGGFELGVGFEMFGQGAAQEALDSFARGSIDLAELVKESKYETDWGFPIQYYAPQLEAAKAANNPLIALNVSRALTREVAQKGVAGLPDGTRRRLPEMNLEDEQHRALFDALMAGHPPGGSRDDVYQAQVLWDEAMAERAARFVVARAPARKLVIFAGQAHCFSRAIPERMRRRGVSRVVSVLPTFDGEQPAARAVTEDAAPAARAPVRGSEDHASAALRSGYDYRFVMTRK